jgi:hypothetical protein
MLALSFGADSNTTIVPLIIFQDTCVVMTANRRNIVKELLEITFGSCQAG